MANSPPFFSTHPLHAAPPPAYQPAAAGWPVTAPPAHPPASTLPSDHTSPRVVGKALAWPLSASRSTPTSSTSPAWTAPSCLGAPNANAQQPAPPAATTPPGTAFSVIGNYSAQRRRLSLPHRRLPGLAQWSGDSQARTTAAFRTRKGQARLYRGGGPPAGSIRGSAGCAGCVGPVELAQLRPCWTSRSARRTWERVCCSAQYDAPPTMTTACWAVMPPGGLAPLGGPCES